MDNKFILKSKTVIGALLLFIVAVAPVFGIDFTADDSSQIMQTLDQAIAAAGSILVVWGSLSSNRKPLTLSPFGNEDITGL